MAAPKSIITPQKIWAIWYVQNGYAVFPLSPGTKSPLAGTNGLDDATTDLDQVIAWWTENPHYNIGINCGMSGLLVVDIDIYKAKGATVPFGTIRTIRVITPHDGEHIYFAMPESKHYGCSRGTLPVYIDIRGFGGYVVAPPSVIVEDGKELHYTFVTGCDPQNIQPAQLPIDLVEVLDAAQYNTDVAPTTFSPTVQDAPDLSRWSLSGNTLELIRQNKVHRDRSRVDWAIVCDCIRVGMSDDEIRATFVHYPCGGKYEKRGDPYLARSIKKARAWLANRHVGTITPSKTLDGARGWVRSPHCLAKLRENGARRVSDLITLLDAIMEMCQESGKATAVTSYRDLADRCIIEASSAHRRLARLQEAGLVTVTSSSEGTVIDVSRLLDLAGTLDTHVGDVSLRSTSFLSEHRADDAFTSYPYTDAIQQRDMPTVLMQSLSASGLLLWDTLRDGGTIKQLAQKTGLTVAAVRVTVKRFERAGLLLLWKAGREYWYELNPSAEELLDERREHMVTAGMGQAKKAHHGTEKAFDADRKLEALETTESDEAVKLELRRHRNAMIALAGYQALWRKGIKPRVKEEKVEMLFLWAESAGQPMRVAA